MSFGGTRLENSLPWRERVGVGEIDQTEDLANVLRSTLAR